MDISSYIGGVITAAIAITGIWKFIKVLKEIKSENDTEHDKRQRWDHAADVIEKKQETWDKGLNDVYAERQQIVKRYDGRLSEQDAKIQQLLAMMCMCLRAQDVILEALVAKGIGNGQIQKMHSELKDFIMEQVKQ